MNIHPSIDYFIRAKRSEGKSDRTLDQYSGSLLKFAAFYEGRMDALGLEPTLEAIDVPTVREYIDYLQTATNLRAVSVATHIRPLKVFLRFMEAEEMRGPNPFRRVKVPAFRPQMHETVTDEDFRLLLGTCDLTTNDGRRDYAIMAFLYDTGVRVGELVGLREADIDVKGQMGRVTGKGDKQRSIFFSPQTAMSLTRYLYRRPAKFVSPDGWLWTAVRRSVGGQFSANGVAQMLKRRAAAAGVTGRVNPHTFRHTFATNYLRAGGDLNSLMRLMGHADLSILQTYLNLVNDDLKTKHGQFSPMARAVGGKR